MKRTLAAGGFLVLCLALSARANEESYSASFDFPAVHITPGPGQFVDVRAMDFTYLGQPARPQLPQKLVFYALPPDVDPTSVSVRVTKMEFDDESLLFPVRPCPPLRLASAQSTNAFFGNAIHVVKGMDQAVYGANAFFPAEPAALAGMSRMRKWQLAQVRLSPALFNPISGTLRIVRRVDFEVVYQRLAHTLNAAVQKDSVLDDAALQMVQNPDPARSWYATRTTLSPASGSTSYVILTTDEIYTNSPTLYGLTTHKQNMGFTVHVVTETRVDGNAAATGWNEVSGQSPDGKADRIRKWLQDNYVGLQIEYVLLVGNPAPDWGDLPMKNCHYQAYVYPVDGYYADLTGNWDIDGNGFFGNETNDVTEMGGVDQVPEVYVGRIPVYTADPSWPTVLRNIIWKTIQYELEPGTAWRRAALLPESFSDLYTDGGYLGEHARNNYLSSKGFKAHTQYEQGSVNPSFNSVFPSDAELLDASTVRNWMNNAYGVVLWWGHGWSRGAVVYSGGTLFETEHCPLLDNRRPASVFMISCTCGDPADDLNVSYSMLRNGGIASVAAGNVSWYYYCSWSPADSKGMNASMGYDFFRKVVSNETTFGRALAEVKQEMESWWWNNYYTFSLYGDPSLRITSGGADGDGDGMPDAWENANGLNAGDPSDAAGNPDGDDYTNREEYEAGLHPQVSDSPATSYSSIAVAATFNGWNTTAHPLRRIGNGQWQRDLVLTNQSGVQLKFAANGSWTTNWGEYNQLATNVPFSGMADWDSDNIVVAGTLNGSYRFTFNDLTRGYRIEPTPAADSDGDGLPDTWENANGLNPHNAADADLDGDGDAYNNLQEYQRGSDPRVWNARAASYNVISVAGTFNGWNAGATNMCLVADHVWRYDATFTNQGGIEFKFAANEGWAVNWGDTNQYEYSPPMSGYGDSAGANLSISGMLNGSYRFTFDDQLLLYTVSAISVPDNDGDGMSDDWEGAHGLNPKGAWDAGQDADGDGLSNRDESDLGSDPWDRDSDDDGADDRTEAIAGTHPNSAASIFGLDTLVAPSSATLSWPGTTGRTYCLFSSTGLQSSAWMPVPGQTNIAGQAGEMSVGVSLPTDSAPQFYKIRVRR